ncbi:thiol-disulfide oxidoreductase DCC family protein [Saccharopolyspora sp. MS10]|uniref:thiol-disulfide oxidoreductase DCC family protein n=1 Tax=Saccharopolyspora sp. MS10 TaxID=3385973 RepID=UPI0039A34B85
MGTPVLIYDGDCGFCTRSVRIAARLPLRARIAPWQEADLAALRTTEQRARHEVLWVDERGAVSGGAAAVAALLRHCGFPWSVPGFLLSLPVLRAVAALVYRAIAANRHRLPGATPACALPPERRPGA